MFILLVRAKNPDTQIVEQLARAIVNRFPCTKNATGLGHVMIQIDVTFYSIDNAYTDLDLFSLGIVV